MSGIDYSRFDKIGIDLDDEDNTTTYYQRRPAPNDNPEAPPQQGAVAPRLQQRGEDEEDSSDDEDLNHPMFWTKIPKDGIADGYKKAFADMIYDGKTPDELAEQFKENGNSIFAQGKKFFPDALQRYEEALEWASKGSNSVENKTTYAAILSNRAAINLQLKNYGSVKRDCRAAVKYGPDPLPNCKPHFRGAKACVMLKQWKEAYTFSTNGLKIEPENTALLKLHKRIKDTLDAEAKLRKKKEREAYEELRLDEQVRRLCKKKNLRVGPLTLDISQYTGKNVHTSRGGAPRPVVGSGDVFKWPVVLLYPEFSQTDFVQEFDETTTFVDILMQMFPVNSESASIAPPTYPPWDPSGYYDIENMVILFQERSVRPFNMDKPWTKQYSQAIENEIENMDYSKRGWVIAHAMFPLLKVLQHPEYVIAGVPVFHIVSKKSPFYATFVKQCDNNIKSF